MDERKDTADDSIGVPEVYCPDCMWEPLARDPQQSDAGSEPRL